MTVIQTVKKWLKSVYICGSYRKIKTITFWTHRYTQITYNQHQFDVVVKHFISCAVGEDGRIRCILQQCWRRRYYRRVKERNVFVCLSLNTSYTLYKVAVLSYECQHGLAPTYLRDELRRPADTESRRRLRSASSTSLDVRRTRLSTVGDRAFPAAAARLWNSLPSHVTAAPLSLSIFCCRLKSHLFSLSYPAF